MDIWFLYIFDTEVEMIKVTRRQIVDSELITKWIWKRKPNSL